MLFPKKQKKKKTKLRTDSILHQRDGSCYLCQILNTVPTGPIEEHHVYGGTNRANSERYGLKVYLCRNHHTGTDGVHTHPAGLNMQMLHEIGQRKFEESHSRQDFYEIFGRNYL